MIVAFTLICIACYLAGYISGIIDKQNGKRKN